MKIDHTELLFLLSGRVPAIRAENAWYEGEDADANPYKENTSEHWEWYRTWFDLNKHS